jgi:hypothetical protein
VLNAYKLKQRKQATLQLEKEAMATKSEMRRVNWLQSQSKNDH